MLLGPPPGLANDMALRDDDFGRSITLQDIGTRQNNTEDVHKDAKTNEAEAQSNRSVKGMIVTDGSSPVAM